MSRKTVTLILSLLLIFSAILPAVPVRASGVNRTVRAGFFAYPGYHDYDGEVRSGYGADLLTLLQRHTNLNFTYTGYENSWEEMQEMLLAGEIDLVTSARKTAGREELFDFSEPVGTSRAQINVRADDERFTPGDFHALDGMTIGLLAGNSRNADLERFALEEGFAYESAEFGTAEELTEALSAGTVDAIAASSLRRTSGEKTVAEFAPESFYIIVRKGDTALLDEIDYGIGQMDVSEGNWRDDLMYANYGEKNADILAFTIRERAYIRAVQDGEKSVTAIAQPGLEPYSYVKNGGMTGIIPDYFAHLMEMAGLPYTLLVPEDADEYRAWAQNGRADVILDCRGAADAPGLLTDAYLDTTVSRVIRKGFSGEVRTVAVSGPDGREYAAEESGGTFGYMTVETAEKAMKAVSESLADVCYVDTHAAEAFINNDPSVNLQQTVLRSSIGHRYISVDPGCDHELASILNKCIRAEAAGTADRYVQKYTASAYDALTFVQYMRLNPGIAFIIAALIALLIGLTAWYVVGNRTEKMKTAQLEREIENQRKLEEALALAESASRAKTEFLFNMSHDIRTPMNAILGYTDIALRHNVDPEKTGDCLKKIKTSGHHLLSLINDILEMSRIEAGRLDIVNEPVYACEVTETVADMGRALAAAKDIVFRAETGEMKNPYVYSDELHTNQIVVNLISNAIKYTEPGGTVDFRVEQVTEPEDGVAQYRITVRDSGIGMSEEFQEHLFESFARENTSTVSGQEGAGLGLAIVKRIVDAIGGTIRVESRRNEGSVFTVDLPLRVLDDEAIETFRASHDGNTGPAGDESFAGKKVLLVEDNEMNREIAAEILEDAGLTVETAENGSAAVRRVEETGPGYYDCILMDIQMPVMNGYDATKIIRERYPDRHIPIIALSANAFTEDKAASAEAGMDDHVAKPIDIAKLKDTLAKFL